jgi:hypothetical protein
MLAQRFGNKTPAAAPAAAKMEGVN